MNSLTCDRFISTLRNNAEKLRESNQGGLNPTETRPFGDFRGVFSDRCEYVYSLYALDRALDSITSLAEFVSKVSDPGWSGRQVTADHLSWFGSELAFFLRGYVGALSEEVMVLENEKLKAFSGYLRQWLHLGFSSGNDQNAVRSFLWGCALNKICDVDSSTGMRLSQQDKDKFIEQRVNREMIAFRDVLQISRLIMKNICDGDREYLYAKTLVTNVSSVPLLNPGI